MKRKHKLYSNPKKPFDKPRIEEEKKIIEEFGLKNKKEIWKAEAKVKLIRGRARNLIKSPTEKQKILFDQLKEIGIKADSLTSVFALETKDYLERRLQTIVFKKGLAKTIKEARQKIVHRKILVDGKIINKPSYLVPVELENKITIKNTKKSAIKKEILENQTLEAKS